ncbi:death-on-curing protein [Nitrospirillum amazonense]|uniref:Death-on-curing protein n=1 Tax=Nitrospirillum amazonense TaxID=28077 RepID=A0A560F5M2_9PROT|nr:type II toxin-antitoxin system death-on-curing family toxin [Nitrospirillum amazonense]TWB16918.1 death-on-curing protein [Nitrospirillum amazonense]
MTEFLVPPIEAIIDLHAELLAEHGGASGLRDRGALEASLARAHQIIAYAEGSVTVFDLAAAVCVSILRNHPFVDGNKRAGFVALGTTLILNGLFLDVSEREAADMILAVAASERSEEEFRRWVADNSVKG